MPRLWRAWLFLEGPGTPPVIPTATVNRMLDLVFRGQPVWVSLHSNEPGEDGASEVAGYQRQQATFARAQNRSSANENTMEFRDLPATMVSHVAVWDAQEGGTFLWGSDRMATVVEVPAGGIVRIEAGKLTPALFIK